MPRSEVAKVVRSGSVEFGGQGPVRMRIIRTTPEENTIELSINYAKAEVPTRAYYADFCDAIRGRGCISLIFGKLKPGTSELRNKIEIAFPEEVFIRQLWKNSRAIHEKVRSEFNKRPLEPIADLVDTDTVQAFRANNVLMIGASDEGLMDFYYIAPTEIHYAFTQKRTEISLDPVIRIAMSGSLMFEVLEKCKGIVEQLGGLELILEEEQCV